MRLSGKFSFLTKLVLLNPLMTNVPLHIETSQLICIANQLTGFYMMGNIGRQLVNRKIKQTESKTRVLYRRLGLTRWLVIF